MTFKICAIALLASAMFCSAEITWADDLEKDKDDVLKEFRERDQRMGRLSTEEQLKVRAARVQADQDPVVKAALENRNRAIREYREALRNSMIKADPEVKPILDKVVTGQGLNP